MNNKVLGASPMTNKQIAAVGKDKLAWPDTFDGMAWAIEFNKRFPSVPVDDALAWFANAIMRGYDHANQSSPTHQADEVKRLEEDAPLKKPKVDLIQRAFDRGYKAFMDGRGTQACPYLNDKKASAWLSGFNEASRTSPSKRRAALAHKEEAE